MSKSFSMGDLVEIVDNGHIRTWRNFIGREAIVIGGPTKDTEVTSGYTYEIKINGEQCVFSADPTCLRKKRPPAVPDWNAIAAKQRVPDGSIRSPEYVGFVS